MPQLASGSQTASQPSSAGGAVGGKRVGGPGGGVQGLQAVQAGGGVRPCLSSSHEPIEQSSCCQGETGVQQAGEMKVSPLGTVPEKSAALDYYSEGMFIVEASDPPKCPIVWLNAICREMIGEQPSHTWA